jgi:hypothetical protein
MMADYIGNEEGFTFEQLNQNKALVNKAFKTGAVAYSDFKYQLDDMKA